MRNNTYGLGLHSRNFFSSEETRRIGSKKWNLILDQYGRNILFYIWNDFAKTQLILQSTYQQNIQDCKKLLEQKDATGCTFLRYACSQGYNSKVLKVVLYHTAAVGIDWGKDSNENGDTLLHSACQNSNIAVFITLLELDKKCKFIVTKKTNVRDESCLHYARKNSGKTIAKVLMQSFPDLINEKVFQTAIRQLDKKFIQIFAQCDTPPKISMDSFMKNQNFLQQRYSNVQLVEWLAGKHPVLLASVTTEQGRTSLHVACGSGNLSMAKKLVELDPKLLRKKDEKKRSVLHLAVLSSNLHLLQWLAEQDPLLLTSVTQEGITPLHIACVLGNVSVVEKLVELDQKILGKTGREEKGILHLAVLLSNLHLLQWLAEQDPLLLTRVTPEGKTPLHFACQEGNFSVAKKLVELDPKLLQKTDELKNSALHFAAVSGNEQLVEWLPKKDTLLLASVTQEGVTPLHVACKNGNLSVVKKLVELDPKILRKTDKEETSVLNLAVLSGNLQLVEWLAEKNSLLLASVSK